MKQPLSVHFWSATPTPLTPQLTVDVASVERMIGAAVADGITGLFLAGTCGEGPWLPNRERRRLIEAAVDAAGGRLEIAAQVSDNSAARVLDNIHEAAAAGAKYAIIAPPSTLLNATPERIAALFEEAVSASPLPVGIYDLGSRRPLGIPGERLKDIYLLPNVHLVKDSSAAPDRREIALAARREKPSLRLFNGDEFRCLEYLEAGYDGCLFGGAVAVPHFMQGIARLLAAGRLDEARLLEQEMRSVLFGIYGGESIACWLTGLKYYMVRRGVFESPASYLGYPLTDECRAFVDRYVSTEAATRTAATLNAGERRLAAS